MYMITYTGKYNVYIIYIYKILYVTKEAGSYTIGTTRKIIRLWCNHQVYKHAVIMGI